MALFIGASILRAAEQPAPWSVWANTQTLDTGWQFLAADSVSNQLKNLPERRAEPARPTNVLDVADHDETYKPRLYVQFQAVTLPHTWNAKDTLDTVQYRRGSSWYRRALTVSDDALKQRLFLRFGAAGQQAAVFVNGKPVGEHVGGYSAFTVELTGHVHAGENTVTVRVSNAPSELFVPIGDGLFNLYGGLYRSVELIRAPRVCLSRNYRGGPGVRVWSENVSEQQADVQVWAKVEGDGVTVAAELADAAGKVVASGSGRPGLLSLSKVEKPQLWSPERPVLYTLTVRLLKDGREVDRAVVRHGFRWFQFTADHGFFLNGKPYKLHGVNRHQDLRGQGNAVSLEQHWNDLRTIKELGANWLRLAHYQQDDYVLQLCDELGLLAWEEIPFVRDTNLAPEFEHNVQGQLTEMIEQHFNHPSIILWGMGNEIRFKKGNDGRAAEFGLMERLNQTIHREDPVRKSVIVSGDANTFSNLKIMTIPDVIAYNLYRGWYNGNVGGLTARLKDLHRRDPNKPMIVSEFGAGCDPWIHSENPKMFDQSQEYQVFFLESYLKQLAAVPWLSGYNWWNFADFGWAQSKVPKFYNNKGFLTWDRQTKKDSFYAAKACWSAEPVLYLCSPSWTNRTGAAQKEYRVLTNLPSVELFQNGKSLGVQTKGFVWTVTLQPGANELRARAGQMDHGFTVNYNASATAPDATGLEPVRPADYNPFNDDKK